MALSLTLAPSPYQTVLDTAGNPVAGALIWTYLIGTSTLETTYTDVNGATPNTNPIVADSAGRFVAFLPAKSFTFVYENPATPPAHGTVIKTVDVPSVALSFAGVDVPAAPGLFGTIATGLAVYLSDGSGGLIAGSWYVTSDTQLYSSTLPVIGIVVAALFKALSGANSGQVRTGGRVTGLVGLTPGVAYYAGAAGALTTTPSPDFARIVGYADSTTSLIVTANPVAPSVRLLVKSPTLQTVANIATPVEIFKPSILGGLLGADRILRLTVEGEYVNTSGAPATLSLDVVYGATTLIGGAVFAFATGTRGAVRLVLEMSEDAGPLQRAVATLTTPASGVNNAGSVWTAHGAMAGFSNTSAENPAVTKSLTVSVTHSVASVSVIFNKYAAMVELIGA